MKGLDEFVTPRPWKLPSFDPPPPPPPPPPSWKQEEIDAAFDAARLAGHAEGLAQGTEEGLAEGLARGLSEGREAGHHEAFDAAEAKLEKLAAALKLLIDEMAEFPDAIAAPVVDLALLIAQRLTGNASFERAAFVQAVQEALMHLPLPGEKLLLRIGPADEKIWLESLDSFDLPFGHVIVVDADLPAGRAFVEVGGTRLDIGPAARNALVRAALGLSLD